MRTIQFSALMLAGAMALSPQLAAARPTHKCVPREAHGCPNQKPAPTSTYGPLRAVHAGVQSPLDPNHGVAVGRRRRHPIKITKETDVGSPVIFQTVHGVGASANTGSGGSSGKRRHHTIKVTKELGAASPTLLQAAH
jgi:hypothetical protein